MTAIEAPSGRVQNRIESGIRPFDIATDLRPVADLIAEAFAAELDPRGSAALREMRMMSNMGGLLKVLNRTTGEFRDLLKGYVWIEAGRVVGNVTVQRADRFGNRWQIANVAVAPAYRGRGIANRLMDAALERIEDAGAKWAVLQVYEANAPARHIYERLGFDYMGGTAELRMARLPVLASDVRKPTPPRIANFHSFSSSQGSELYELANRQLNAQSQWWRPLRRSEFQTSIEEQIGEWFWRNMGRRQLFRRCIRVSPRFEAALVLTAQRWQGEHNLKLWVRPEHYGEYEDALFQWVTATLYDYPRLPVTLSLPTSHVAGLAAAYRAGFETTRALLTMRRDMRV
jgi:ribosomal protein S18 acetylase RimI-like enzyme